MPEKKKEKDPGESPGPQRTQLSMGPYCVTRYNPTHQLTDPTQPNPLQVEKFGPNPTQPNPIKLTMELTVS